MQRLSRSYYLGYALGLLIVGSPPTIAFAPNTRCSKNSRDVACTTKDTACVRASISSTSTILYAGSSSDDKKDDFDVEAARKQLESIMLGTTMEGSDSDTKSGTGLSPNDKSESSFSALDFLDDLISPNSTVLTKDDIELPPPPPLSTIERDRREAEINSLKCLDATEEASNDLWTLWYSERGASAKAQLEAADSLMGNPKTFNMAEQFLREQIDKHGIYFVEPLNRLATLYFLQNKFEESYKLCLVILKIKPWHFGALAGIVQVCIGLGGRDAARSWAEKRLPNMAAGDSFPPFATDGPLNPRRKEWVDKQVAAAEKQLKTLERETKKSFGKPDSYVSKERGTGMSNERSDSGIQESDDDNGAWM